MSIIMKGSIFFCKDGLIDRVIVRIVNGKKLLANFGNNLLRDLWAKIHVSQGHFHCVLPLDWYGLGDIECLNSSTTVNLAVAIKLRKITEHEELQHVEPYSLILSSELQDYVALLFWKPCQEIFKEVLPLLHNFADLLHQLLYHAWSSTLLNR